MEKVKAFLSNPWKLWLSALFWAHCIIGLICKKNRLYNWRMRLFLKCVLVLLCKHCKNGVCVKCGGDNTKVLNNRKFSKIKNIFVTSRR